MSSKNGGGKAIASIGSGMLTFMVLWALAGLAALIMSLYCWIGYTSPDGCCDLAGILMAIFLGPFYWIFYWYKKTGYCGKTA